MKKTTFKKFAPLLMAMVFAPFLMGPGGLGCPECGPPPNCDVCKTNLVAFDVIVKPHGAGSLVVVWIKNTGPEASKGLWVDVFVTSSVAQKTEKNSEHYLWNYGVKGNGVEAVTFYVSQSPEELEWLDVIVDSTGMVSEMKEQDNHAEFDLRYGVK